MLYPKSFGDAPVHPHNPQGSDFAVVLKSKEAGNGVITLRSFRRHDVLAVMNGERIAEIRQHTLQIEPNLHLFDPYFSGCFLHSCEPNISLDMHRLTVTALHDIPANSYLYMDYAQTEDVLFRQFPCACGSNHCRGWITGRKEWPHSPMSDALISHLDCS